LNAAVHFGRAAIQFEIRSSAAGAKVSSATDALPLLVAAQSVTVLVVDPEASDRHGQEPGIDIALFLARHGVHVDVERRSSHGTPVAEVILCCTQCRSERHRRVQPPPHR
jgi:nucleotide-binding universal stress UspA family protein